MKTLFITVAFSLCSSQLAFAQSGPPIQDTTKVVNVSKKVLESYIGLYSFEEAGIQVEFMMEDKKLMVSVPSTGTFQLIPGSKTAFRVRELGAQLEFSKNGEGPVKLYQGSRVFNGEKIEKPEVDYVKVIPGDASVNYNKLFTPFTAEWNLIIREKKVGTATTILRHTVFNEEPAYRAGSTIRYESMKNVPFDDIGIFSKKDFAKVWARNAISQSDEITSTFNGTSVKQEFLNIKTGDVTEIKNISYDDSPVGAGIYLFLASDIKEGLAIQFPVAAIAKSAWAKAHVTGKETIRIESLDKTFDAWKIEYASGTVHWVVDEAPYMVKWKMPTGMIWELASYGN